MAAGESAIIGAISSTERRSAFTIRSLTVALFATTVFALKPAITSLPSNATPCLHAYGIQHACKYQEGAKYYRCICGYSNDQFLQDFAGCLGRTDQVDVPDSYQYLSEICDASKVPVKISRESFFEAAGVVDPDAGLDTEPKPDGISTGAQAGIAIGIIVAVAAALGGLICFFCRYKGRKIKTAVEVKSCSFQELSSSTTTLPRTLPTPAELSSPPLSTLSQPLPAELSALASPPPEYTPSSASVVDSLQTQSQTVPPQTPLAWTYLESAMGPQTMAGHGSPLDEKTILPGTQDRNPSYELEDTSPTTPEPAVQSEKRMEKV